MGWARRLSRPASCWRQHGHTYLYFSFFAQAIVGIGGMLLGGAFLQGSGKVSFVDGVLSPKTALHRVSSLVSASLVRGIFACHILLCSVLTTFCFFEPPFSLLLLLFFFVTSTTLAAYVTASPLYFSWHCLYHPLDHDAVHCIEIVFNEQHPRGPFCPALRTAAELVPLCH